MWDKLPEDIVEELRDPDFLNRTHGRRSTSAAGCNGPLCRKAERDAAHEKYARRRAKEGKPPARVGLRNDKARERDELLENVLEWHILQREYAKLNRHVQTEELAS